ncbi:GNAT family N-acetyltransferase [Clostridium uliginosum]|uniref:Acetyltransferase (GNAT) family protein n=1 Tax=Clostridium uliginosum TaxID=119641 RepID=A0A1I1PWX5_9CLOT|nr:GNAT family N-acetyltransferase [Clostridium uliginosum]SFD14396.1 Acetyltransferase (GNAT) family protein [Clostridium uliginosum]
MKTLINLKRQDGAKIDAEFKFLDEGYIDKIMELQEGIMNGIKDEQLYVPSNEEEFIDYINNNGKVIGCVTKDSDELIAVGVYRNLGYKKDNYGYDIELQGDELLKVGQIEATVVREDFRGNRLQKILCEHLEVIGKENKTPIMCATASPYNEHSLNTFKCLGYKIAKDKLKYGGLRRYVLVKDLGI